MYLGMSFNMCMIERTLLHFGTSIILSATTHILFFRGKLDNPDFDGFGEDVLYFS